MTELSKKYDITHDPNVQKFSKMLTRIAKRMQAEGYQLWASGAGGGLWITKQGLTVDNLFVGQEEVVDSFVALMKLVDVDLAKPLYSDDYQLTEDK